MSYLDGLCLANRDFALCKKGTNLLGLKWYRYIISIFGGILIFYGITFLIDAINL